MAKRHRQVPRNWTLSQRLQHYSRPGPNNCRLWTAFVGPGGFGQLWWKGRDDLAHRLAWVDASGRAVPTGMMVCHRCDVRACINAEHLYLRTKPGRIADTVAKGRQAKGEKLSAVLPKGERHHRAKLDERKVQAILRDRGSHRAIAARFGVDHSTVGRIKRGRSWKIVTRTTETP